MIPSMDIILANVKVGVADRLLLNNRVYDAVYYKMERIIEHDKNRHKGKKTYSSLNP